VKNFIVFINTVIKNCTYQNTVLVHVGGSMITPAIWIFFLIFNFVLMLLDFITTMKGKSKCDFKYFYVVDDPFGFRTEQLVMFITFISFFWIIPWILFFLSISVRRHTVGSLQFEFFSIIQSLILIVWELG
jgi:hypothetical protein